MRITSCDRHLGLIGRGADVVSSVDPGAVDHRVGELPRSARRFILEYVEPGADSFVADGLLERRFVHH